MGTFKYFDGILEERSSYYGNFLVCRRHSKNLSSNDPNWKKQFPGIFSTNTRFQFRAPLHGHVSLDAILLCFLPASLFRSLKIEHIPRFGTKRVTYAACERNRERSFHLSIMPSFRGLRAMRPTTADDLSLRIASL